MSLSLLNEHGGAGGASVMFAENSVSHGNHSLVGAATKVLAWALVEILTVSPVGCASRGNRWSVVPSLLAERVVAQEVRAVRVGKVVSVVLQVSGTTGAAIRRRC